MKAIDPVCHMEVDTETAEWISEYDGQKYFFCAAGCKRSFDQNPKKYLSGESGHEHGQPEHGHHH